MATSTIARPRMSEGEARTFSRQSMANAALVASHFRCGCDAYADVFTFNRWRAQGFGVCKGEHGLRLPLVREVDEADEDGPTGKTARILGASWVFCRHQVKPYGEKMTAARAAIAASAPGPVAGTGPAVQSSMGIGEGPTQGTLLATAGPPDITPPLTKAPSFQADVMATWQEV